MPQVTMPPGFAIAAGIYIFAAAGDPNTLSLTTFPTLAACGIGSLFLRTDGSTSTSLYVCTVAGVPATPQGIPATAATWTAK